MFGVVVTRYIVYHGSVPSAFYLAFYSISWIELWLILRYVQGYLKNISCGIIQGIYIPHVFVYEVVVPWYIGNR